MFGSTARPRKLIRLRTAFLLAHLLSLTVFGIAFAQQQNSAGPITGSAGSKRVPAPTSKAGNARTKRAAPAASTEEADWADAVKSGTPEAYTAFHIKYPNSARLMVRTGAIKWVGGFHVDSSGIVLNGVTIGDFSLSITPQEGAILGLLKQDGSKIEMLGQSTRFSIPGATVLLKDGKVVACQEGSISDVAMPNADAQRPTTREAMANGKPKQFAWSDVKGHSEVAARISSNAMKMLIGTTNQGQRGYALLPSKDGASIKMSNGIEARSFTGLLKGDGPDDEFYRSLGVGATVILPSEWIELFGVTCKGGSLTVTGKGLEFENSDFK